MNSQEALAWLYSTQTYGIKLGLKNAKKLLLESDALPSPEVKVIHVAGTNGKGSVCAIIDSILRAAGKTTGLYTSPHLVHYRERIQVSGEYITDKFIEQGLCELRQLIANWQPHPTFFELTLALAMKYFKLEKCDYIILETGMGGRLDATTAVPADACIITPIALDHKQWLGNTLAEIAEEKAGILVNGKPAFFAKQQTEAHKVLEQQAKERKVSEFKFVENPIKNYNLPLRGEHQLYNAALAIEAVKSLPIALNSHILKKGLSDVAWPGRFEVLKTTLNNGNHGEIILDVAHNPAAIEELIKTYKNTNRSKPLIIFSSAKEKDFTASINLLSEIAKEFHLPPINSSRSIAPQEMQNSIPKNIPSFTYKNVKQALSAVKRTSFPVLITGSAFLVGEAKSILENQFFAKTNQ